MSLFKQPKPRRFDHKYIYVDERKEYLKEIENKARRELRMLPHEVINKEELHKAFSEAMPHTYRHAHINKGYGLNFANMAMLALLLLLFCLILIFLL